MGFCHYLYNFLYKVSEREYPELSPMQLKEFATSLALYVYAQLSMAIEQLGYHEVKEKSLVRPSIARYIMNRIDGVPKRTAELVADEIIKDLYL